MNENSAIAVIAAAWTVVQVTRATYAYRAGQNKARREAAARFNVEVTKKASTP